MLKEQNIALEKECSELRFKLYETKLTQQKLSETADQDFLGKAHEIMVGVVRKAQGKLN